MAITIRIDPETGLAMATCTGVLLVADAREGAAALWHTPGWPGRAVVWDFRDARFEISPAEIREIAHFVLRDQPSRPRRVAFVTPRDVDFGLARIFEALREDPPTEFNVFRDFDQAVAWARAVLK
ncbi:MAG: hypothetical protein KIS92_13815 [Planctomycetota bacterium]|nr:hypothetical protein [Planctomycetota bacterium]